MSASRVRLAGLRSKYLKLLLPVTSVLLALLGCEAGLRAWQYFRWNIAFFDGQPTETGNLSSITLDSRLGWRATPHYRFSGKKRSSDGVEYTVNVSQDANGFRMFGDLKSSDPRVFVIGDSFTQAVQVSDDKTYYAPLKSGLNIFAYGAGGWGTLQEFMILDKHFDVIKPSLIIWQFSMNDLINNSPELEMASTNNNNDMVRPYWVDGRIQYILPRSHAARLRLLALKDCRLCYMVLNRLDRLLATMPLTSVESETSPGKPAHADFEKSVVATNEIMGMVRNRAGSTPIVGFTVGADPLYGPEYIESLNKVAQNHSVVLANVEDDVLDAEAHGTVVRAADNSHWNEAGHRIAGQALVRFLSDHQFIKVVKN